MGSPFRTVCVSLLALLPLTAPAQTGLADASLEQLLSIQVTTVSKKEQRLSRAASAVFVISQEDIRRSGAENIPDLLRMVPGVQVARMTANAWAITVRGFNNRYSNKVLVLVDGRCVYTASFSGVYWDQQDLPLEDIDRIEVIRGPGATIWGVNAVNGVINIITKPAKATRGGLAVASAGPDGEGRTMVRYGGAAGRDGNYRGFLQYSHIPESGLPDGSPGRDGWWRAHGGFRSDWDLSPQDALTVQGDLSANRESQTMHRWFYPAPFDPPFGQKFSATGGDLMAEWSHAFAGGSSASLNAYYDSYRRDDFAIPESQKTFDLEFNHHIPTASRHDIVWGFGYRSARSGVAPGYQVTLAPPMGADNRASAFLQDEIQVAPGVWLTLGSKFEHNSYTGFEYEPSVRLAWTLTRRHTLWAAASRAIRQPSREEMSVDADLISYPLGPGMNLDSHLFGNPRQRSEQLHDYEIGYRTQWNKRLSLDTTGFLSFYRRLATYEPLPTVVQPGPAGVLVLAPLRYDNLGRATNYGAEATVNCRLTPFWRLSPGYALLHVNMRLDPGSSDQYGIALAGNAPRHSFQMRSLVNLGSRVEWDQSLYWNGRTPNGGVSAHARFDTRLSWKLGESAEVSLVGQNLLRPGQMEFADSFNVVGTRAERTVFGKIAWRF